MKMTNHLSSFFFLSLPYPILFLSTFVSLPIILRSIQKQDYGSFFFIIAVCDWLTAATGTNILSGMKRGIARGEDGTFIFAFLRRLMLLSIVIVPLIIAPFFLKGLAIEKTLSRLIYIVPLALLANSLFKPIIIEFFVAKKQFGALAVWKIIMYTVPYATSAFVAYLTRNVVLFALTQLGTLLFICLVCFSILIGRYRLFPSYREGKINSDCYAYGLKLITVDLISITSFKMSTFLIGPLLGFGELAVFAVANNLRDRVSEFIKNIRSFFYADFSQSNLPALVEKVGARMGTLILFSLCISFVIALIGIGYIKFILPADYSLAALYFIILSFSFPASIIDIVLMTMLESQLRHKELILRRVIP
jgi:O-antigen/teichoic acid export membrane protein